MTETTLTARDSLPMMPIDMLREGASSGNGMTIIASPRERESRTYKDIISASAGAATDILNRGIQPGDRVAIVADTSFEFVVGCIALLSVGVTVMPIDPPPRFKSKARWLGDIRERLSRTSAAALIAPSESPLPDVGVPTLRIAANLSASPEDLPQPRPEDLAAVHFTSGSTAAQKGVAISHATLALRLAQREWAPMDQRHHLLRWEPLANSFLWAGLRTIACGASVTLMSTQVFLADPVSWLMEISDAHATHSGAPNFGFNLAAALLEQGLPKSIDLSSWESATCSGERVEAKTLTRFAGAAAPHGFDPTAFSPKYASSEAGAVTYWPVGRPFGVDHVDRGALARGEAWPTAESAAGSTSFVNLGAPTPDYELSIVDDEGRRVQDRRIGEIVVRGLALMDGYLDDPQATEEALAGGALRTGDVGYMVDGELFVTGRAKDIIIVRGQNYHAGDIESIVAEAIGDADASCAAFGVRDGATEGLVIALETPAPDDEATDALVARVSQSLWAALGLKVMQTVLVEPGGLDKTPNGKLQRAAIKLRFEAGELTG